MTKQTYQAFKEVMSKEQYYTRWLPETLNDLSESIQDYIYNKYLFKCQVLQRDNFECQNDFCKTPNSPLTIHHIKWQKNGGENKPRNGLAICKACHVGFNRGKFALKIKDRQELPSHIRGHTFKIQLATAINWKKIKKEMSQLRKNVKEEHGRNVHLTLREIIWLMRLLHVPYYELAYHKFEDDVESVYDIEIDPIIA